MKAGESFTLTYNWWKAGQPVTLRSTGLGEALKAFETADKAFQAKKTGQNYVAVTNALAAVDLARVKAIGMCSDKMHADTKAALQRASVIDQRRTLYKTIMIQLLEPRVKEAEDRVTSETKTALAAEKGAESLRTLIEKAIAENNKSEIEKQGKEIGRRETNVRTSLSVPASDEADKVAVDIKGPGIEALAKRVAAARKKSMSENVPKLKTITKLADEFRPYIKDD